MLKIGYELTLISLLATSFLEQGVVTYSARFTVLVVGEVLRTFTDRIGLISSDPGSKL